MCIEISTSQIAPGKHRKHILERTVVWVSKSSGVLDPRKSHSFVRQRVSLVRPCPLRQEVIDRTTCDNPSITQEKVAKGDIKNHTFLICYV